MYCDWPVLTRCCFCLPLRRGVLTYGYIHLIVSMIVTGMYSTSVYFNDEHNYLSYHGAGARAPPELCVALYCLEIVFSALLIYGTHTRSVPYIKAFYYFSITTLVAAMILQIVDAAMIAHIGYMLEMLLFFVLTGLALQIYLIILVSSLLKKLTTDGPHTYENQLNMVVTGEAKIEQNGI